MSTHVRPTFYRLSHDDAAALLERNHVGRLAFTFHDRVDIEPISYVFVHGSVFGRTAPGTKLTTLEHHPWVAFEVDEVEGQFDWRSVVVRGTLYLIDPHAGEHDREAHARAVAALRSLDPDVLTRDDSAPDRLMIFQIFPDEITGRGASSTG
jgi:nitroimidazol reductase NimA-like FMN-containing flavoprotein (pyridoxamine 5'-phosphate oxidase superfamily)